MVLPVALLRPGTKRGRTSVRPRLPARTRSVRLQSGGVQAVHLTGPGSRGHTGCGTPPPQQHAGGRNGGKGKQSDTKALDKHLPVRGHRDNDLPLSNVTRAARGMPSIPS